MPQDLSTHRSQQGRFQCRFQGLDGPSHAQRLQQRYGPRAAPLNLRGVCNALVGGLLLSTTMPAMAFTPAADQAASVGRAPTTGLLPMARAMDMEMCSYRNDAAATADAPLMSASVPSQLGNLVADTASATCAFSPRRCGMAVAVGAGVVALGGGTLVLNHLLGGGAKVTLPERPPFIPLDADRGPTRAQLGQLQTPLRFNASELDPAHPPCDSLGAHVNARWEADATLEKSRTRLGTFEQLRDRSLLVRYELARQIAAMPEPDAAEKVIGDLWVTGMDERQIEGAGLAPLQPELDRIAQLDDREQLLDYVFSRAALARNPLFEFNALPDLENPSIHMAYLGQAGLGLADSAWYADPAKARIVDAYQLHVARTLRLSGMTAEQAADAAVDVLAIERQLADASEPFSVLATDVTQYHNPVDVAQAHAETPMIDWAAFFAAQGMLAPQRFSLGMPRFFQRLDELLGSTPMPAWKSYLRFHALERAAPCLDTAFVNNHAAFHDVVLKGRATPVPRWARVLDIIEHCAGDAFSRSYVQAAYPEQAAHRMNGIVDALSGALKERLAGNEWMDDASRAEALRKAATLRVESGHAENWPQWEGAGTRRQDFLHDVQAADAHVHRRNIAAVGHPADLSEWKMTPQTADAYQDPTQNRIVVPAALLQPPFFDPEGDDALNFGGIGVVIGHEMAHGFDSIGSTFDSQGRLRDWWSPDTRRRFDALADRLAQQFSRYEVAGRKIDGELTLDENLADLGGLAIALRALRDVTAGSADPLIDGMTREQRFFANFAFTWRLLSTPQRTELELDTDNHVPGHIRADGAPSNLAAFAEAFNCTPGDPMARPDNEQVRFL